MKYYYIECNISASQVENSYRGKIGFDFQGAEVNYTRQTSERT